MNVSVQACGRIVKRSGRTSLCTAYWWGGEEGAVSSLWGIVIASVGACVWIVLIAFRGGFWRLRESLPPERSKKTSPEPDRWPNVTVIVPARNEATVLAKTLPSLLDQDYPGRMEIILVDDESEDGTGTVAINLAAVHANGQRLRVVEGGCPPHGWRGKVWAMTQGVKAAAADRVEYLLFTDADIQHGPSVVRSLVAHAQAGSHDMVSIMADLHVESAWDRLLVPSFVYFFAKLYPFRWVADVGRRTAAAAGGCVLVRAEALRKAGGLAPIAPAVIDDCSLAALLKRSGARLWLGFSDAVRSVRVYGTLRSSWEMVARSAYAQLRYSPWLLALTLIGMLWIYAAPPALLVAGLAGWPPGPLQTPTLAIAAGTVALMMISYIPILRKYGQPWVAANTLPLAAVLYTAMTLASAWRTWRGQETAWKSRPTTRL